MSFFRKLFNRKEHTGGGTPGEENRDLFEEDEETDTGLQKGNYFAVETKEPATLEEEQEVYEVVEREILPAKIICPDCGGITLEGLDFCDKCGGELK